MRKIFSIILVLVILTSVMVASAEVSVNILDKTGNLPDESLSSEFEYSLSHNGRTTATEFDNDEIDYLRNIFSDNNLVYVGPVGDEVIEPDSYFEERWAFQYSQDSEDYYFHFDDEKILVTFINGNEREISQGKFAFKNNGIFNDLMNFFEEKQKQQETVKEEKDKVNMENAKAISNFEIIYTSFFKNRDLADGLKIGVCSYFREGETKKTLIPYVEQYSSEDELVIFPGKYTESNKFIADAKKAIKVRLTTKEGYEYDNKFADSYIFVHEIQINADKYKKADLITVRNIRKQTGEEFTSYITGDKCRQEGNLPVELFSAANNLKHNNKVENFRKLYRSSFHTSAYNLQNSEWGICKYETEKSGEVHAFYFYSENLGVTLISEITGMLNVTPSGVIGNGHNNIINFSEKRAIENGYEVFDYSYAEPFELRIGIDHLGKSIIYFGFFRISDGKNMPMLSGENGFYGDLSSLSLNVKKPTDEKTEAPTMSPEPEETKAPEETEKPTEEATEEPKETATETPIAESTEAPTEEKESAVVDFVDVPKTHWAYDTVHEFAEKKIVLGYGNGYFGADDPITYEHCALLLKRLFGYEDKNNESIPAVREDIFVSVVKALSINTSGKTEKILMDRFTDCGNVKKENIGYISAAVEAGLIVGADGKLFPSEKLTRAETVTLLSRALQMIKS